MSFRVLTYDFYTQMFYNKHNTLGIYHAHLLVSMTSETYNFPCNLKHIIYHIAFHSVSSVYAAPNINLLYYYPLIKHSNKTNTL